MTAIIKPLYITIGIISLVLGCIGIVLPVLPTTPFLLLASYCFAKGSKRFHCWFIKTKIYQKYLEDFVTHKAMTLKTKLSILIFADVMMIFPLVILDSIHIKIFLILLIIYKYYYFFFKIDTIQETKIG